MLAKIFYILIGVSLLSVAGVEARPLSYCRALCTKTCQDFYTDRADAHSFRMRMCIMTCVEHKCPPDR